MRLSETLAKLRHAMPMPGGEDRLGDAPAPRANPGSLRGRCYVPTNLQAGAPLVVVLHGCTQDAAIYDHGAGWSLLAERHGFALLYPEQTRANNSNLCFNWYQDSDSRRGAGEPASIAAMIEAMCAAYPIDRTRIFVTGLSAGGAMTSVMLATYPELFAAGAIIAGLPYGCASGLTQAFESMGGRSRPAAAALGASVRGASPHRGRWPRVSVWHGGGDTIVAPSNADAVVRQWTHLHGLPPTPTRTETVDGHPRGVWVGADGAELIEHFAVAGMAHGIPLMPGTDEGQSGQAGAHMLDVGLSSTDRIAAFFGIAPVPAERPRTKAVVASSGRKRSTAQRAQPTAEPFGMPAMVKGVLKAAPKPTARRRAAAKSKAEPFGVQAVIENALKAAGLMR